MKFLIRSLLITATALLVLAWTARTAETATAPSPSASAPAVDPKFRQIAVVFAKFLEQEHFAKRPIDQTLAREWIESYLKDLDNGRMIFLQSDVDDLASRYGPTITADLKRGEISAAYDIFRLFTRRLTERMTWVEARLNKPFDLTKDETYNPDRTKADWPKDVTEANTLWERRLKNELIAERLAYSDQKKDKNAEPPAQKLLKRYQRFRKNVAEMTSEEVVEYYLSALAHIFDPHSLYLGPDTLEDFNISMKNSLFGIGAVLQINDGYCTIKEVMPGGPAALDKRLQPGDRITAVAQGRAEYVDIVGMRLRDAVKLIRGPKGSEVRLKVIPSGSPDTVRSEITLVRDEIKIINQRAKAEIIDLPARNGAAPLRAGIIQIPSFYGPINRFESSEGQSSSTTDDVLRLLTKLKEEKVDGIVLDLRNNGGGLLNEAVLLTGLFIDRGPVVQIKDSRGRKHVLEDLERGAAYDGPLAILTNKMSASASEIVAGALQNYGRAIVIGDQSTHGKGTVQTVQELGHYLNTFGRAASAGAIKITIQKFYLPNGHSTQMRGVVPDIILPNPNDYLDLGEDRLPHALAWDEIESERFATNKALAQSLPFLRERSAERIRTNTEFAQLAEDIERLRRRLEHPEVSLVEAQRAQERAEENARRQTRKAALKRLAQSSPTVVRITFGPDESLKVTTEDEPKPAALVDESEDSDSSTLTRSEQFAADLYLKESLQVLGDLISLTQNQEKPASIAAQALPAS